MPTNNGGSADLRMVLEGAFLNDVPEAGQQMTFSRLRIRVDNLVPGATYRVIFPFGERTFVATAAGPRGINVTEQQGCTEAPCDFDLALTTPFTRFLEWAPAIPPAAPAGYLGDPNIEHEIVGSPAPWVRSARR